METKGKSENSVTCRYKNIKIKDFFQYLFRVIFDSFSGEGFFDIFSRLHYPIRGDIV